MNNYDDSNSLMRSVNSYDFVVQEEDMIFELSEKSTSLCQSSSNNMKGLILESGGTSSNLYIGTVINNITYYLTTMPNMVSNPNDKGDIGVALLPFKVSDNMRLSDIADENIFGQMYNVPGTMSQNFAIKSSSTTNNTFRMGYASNMFLSKMGTFSVRTKQIQAVSKVGNAPVPVFISIFTQSNPTEEGQFIMTDSFNLPLGSLYAGVNYRFIYVGDTFFIPFYPPKSNNMSISKINTLVFFPDNFISSSGFITNITNSTLFNKNNCSVIYPKDARDVLSSNMLGTLTDVIFTNSSDCIIGVNYDYCPTTVTCSGKCYSQCAGINNSTCEYNNASSSFSCFVPLSPIDPEYIGILAEITPVSNFLIFWIMLISVIIIIFVIVGSILYHSKKNKLLYIEQSSVKQSSADQSSTKSNVEQI